MDFEELYEDTCSSVTLAAVSGNADILKKLLEKGKGTCIKDNLGWIALHHAVSNGHLDCINVLLKASDLDVNNLSFEGYSPLHIAILRTLDPDLRFTIAKTLLEAGADPNVGGEFPFISILNEAIHLNSFPLVKILLEYKANVNIVDGQYGSSCNVAAEYASLEIVQLLLKQKLMFNVPGKDHYVFFHILLRRFEKRGYLLIHFLKKPQCLALINDFDSLSHTPLSVACRRRCKGAIDLLLDYGADPNLRDKKDRLPLHLAICSFPEDDSPAEDSEFIRLFKMTCKRAINRGNEASYSTLESFPFLVLAFRPGSIRHLLSFLVGENLKPNSVDLVSSSQLLDIPMAFSELNCILQLYSCSWRLSPFSVWCGNRGALREKKTIELFLSDGLNLNDTSMNRIPPLLVACSCIDGYESFQDRQLKLAYILMLKGSDPFIKLRPEHPIPTLVMMGLMQHSPPLLAFLLWYAMPGDLIFTPDVFPKVGSYFVDSINESWNWRLRNYLQTLILLNDFVPLLPMTLTELFYGINGLFVLLDDEEECSFREDFDHLMSLLRHRISSPKSLFCLAALKVRRCLWESRKRTFIPEAIHDLSITFKLPKLQDLLNLNMNPCWAFQPYLQTPKD